MCDVVPLIALILLGRAIWMLIPLQHRAAWSNHPAIQSVITNARAFPTRLRELAWSKWVWLMSPRAEPQDVDNGPRVEVPPLRSVPERITIF
jgi:hypothetical protein